MTDPSRPAGRKRLGTAATIVAMLMAAAVLAGCGKKGTPQPPADEPNTYPQPYPRV
jgi:predicted small lipoprotein YifL